MERKGVLIPILIVSTQFIYQKTDSKNIYFKLIWIKYYSSHTVPVPIILFKVSKFGWEAQLESYFCFYQ